MARAFPAAIAAAFRGEALGLAYLLELDTGGGTPDPLRIVNGDGDVEFAGSTWTVRPMEFDETGVAPHEEAQSLQLRLADADGFWKALLASGAELRGKRATLFRVPRGSLGSGSVEADSLRDTFLVETWERASGAVSLDLKPLLATLELDVPAGTITRKEFPGIPDINSVP